MRDNALNAVATISVPMGKSGTIRVGPCGEALYSDFTAGVAPDAEDSVS